MQGTAMGNALAQDRAKLYIDNKGVTACAAIAPTRECADMNLRHIVYDNLRTNTIDIKWVPSHRQELEPAMPTNEKKCGATQNSTSWLKWAPICPCQIMTQETPGTLP